MKKTNEKYLSKSYRLTRQDAPLSYMLASRHSSRFPLLHFDEETGVNRPLRYARNQKSPFEDEQDGNAILEPVVFEDGFLTVNKQNQVLQQFLHYHPQNGMVFEEINNARDAQEELELAETQLNAQIMAKELSIDKLVTVCRVFLGGSVDKMSTAELKRDVLMFSKESPEDFMNILNDPMLELQDTVIQMFSSNVLQFKNNQKDVHFNYKKNKKRMLTVPFGEDPYYIVASYFQSDEGIESYKMLKKTLNQED
tara:strand:- start:769 stop:1527 length:759 start_codon:yes stop_codon:yes gene_type:complete